jgi:hypothetical protein
MISVTFAMQRVCMLTPFMNFQTSPGPATASILEEPKFDITVRVGCSLGYSVSGTAALLLNVKPRPDRNHSVIFEALSVGNDLPTEQFTDHHGNVVSRVALAPGENCIRHDAIVKVTSQPDNASLPSVFPLSPVELPPQLLRYTLPSRYCDSDSSRTSRGKSSVTSNTVCLASARSANGCTKTLNTVTCPAVLTFRLGTYCNVDTGSAAILHISQSH